MDPPPFVMSTHVRPSTTTIDCLINCNNRLQGNCVAVLLCLVFACNQTFSITGHVMAAIGAGYQISTVDHYMVRICILCWTICFSTTYYLLFLREKEREREREREREMQCNLMGRSVFLVLRSLRFMVDYVPENVLVCDCTCLIHLLIGQLKCSLYFYGLLTGCDPIVTTFHHQNLLHMAKESLFTPFSLPRDSNRLVRWEKGFTLD